jgi:hypothetical protein
MNNPLDSFGAPGVIDAAKEALEDGFFSTSETSAG